MNKNNYSSIITTILIILVQGSLSVLVLIYDKDFDRIEKGMATICLSFYVIIWGILFLLSNYYPEHNIIFKGLQWVCRISTGKQYGSTAIFYFILAIVLGVLGLLYGFGILSQ